MSFEEPPSRTEIGPRHLPRAVRQFKAKARERGLLGYGETTTGEGMEARASALVGSLRGGGRLDPRTQLRVGSVITWLHGEGRAEDLRLVREAVVSGRLKPLSRDWFILICLFYRDKRVARRLGEVWSRWKAAAREGLSKRLGGLGADHLAALPDVLATRVARDGVRVDEVSSTLRIPAGCELEAAVWARLLSPAASAWMLAQPLRVVDALLERRQGHWSVGAIGRQLLEPVAVAGATPEDVAPEKPFAEVVAMVARRMPRDRGDAAWVRLGGPAAELIRWWQTQRDLEKFFREWNADPDRERFWRRYVRHIRGIEAHRSASALAMKIGEFWFVEFGAIGNASRAYRDRDWVSASWIRRRATDPKHLREIPVDFVRRKTHSGLWEPRFVSWVRELTGVTPAGSVR